MNRVILQVPMSRELREKAMSVAMERGFSSLQETIKIFLQKFSKREITFRLSEEPEEKLSPRAVRRYERIIRNIKSGKEKTVAFTNVRDMMKYLKS